MHSVFAGLRSGIVSWLACAVHVVDDGPPIVRLTRKASLFEGKVDVREDHRVRYSAVWEFVPFRFTQVRIGARRNKCIPRNNAQNASEVFVQWNAFF